MFTKLMRRPDVEKAVDLSCASIYRLMSEGRFPRPIRTGKRTVRWKAEDVSRLARIPAHLQQPSRIKRSPRPIVGRRLQFPAP